MKRESSLNLFLVSILSLVLGIILIVATDNILTVFNYIFVCIFGIIGIIQLISFIIGTGYKYDDYSNLIMGIVFIWLALIMYVYYMMIINILPIIFSLYLFIMGSLLVIRYFKEKNIINIKHIRYLIVGIISIIIGILLIFEPSLGVYTYLKITGANIIVISLLFFFEFINNIRKNNG
jgi:uncharacterized membrane protein HdeD (DUF308 family)